MGMKARAYAPLIATVAVTLFACSSLVFADKPTELPRENHIPVCPRGGNSDTDIHCHARVVTDKGGTPSVTQLPAGYGPAQFHSAYTSFTAAPTKQIIAIVDAYDHPNIKSDLDVYSQTFGIPKLPLCAGAIG